MASDTQSSAAAKRRGPSIRETFGLDRYQFTLGKWALLGAAALMIALGLVLARGTPPSAAPGGQASAPSGARPGPLGNSFAESRPPAETTAPTSNNAPGIGAQDFSSFLVKGGFGAVIGFAIGFAVRSFIRLATVIAGFYLLTLTIMAYLGWVEIHWSVMEGQFNHSLTTLGEQLTSFKAFLTGAIPSSGMAALGLAMGLKKR